jgi:uroporphyrinogen-III synthase
MHKQQSLFISRNRNEINVLIDFCANHNIDLITHSFLTFEKVSFSIKESYEAIFFGSPRAVKFFFSQQRVAENCTIIGCIGEMTAESLRVIGIEPTFIGQQAGNPGKVGRQFKEIVGSKRVLFPQAENSNRSVSSLFPADQLEEITCYKTSTNSTLIPNCDYYIFTSPSNVEGFLKANNILSKAAVIAWGKTTEKYLFEQGIVVDYTLKEAKEEEVLNWIDKDKK